MNKLYKTALLAALGLAGVTMAQAQTTDMLLGFNDNNATAAGAHNDYVIDLGAQSSFTTSAVLNGTFSGSQFSTAFSADANNLNAVAAGVVASDPNSTIETLFETRDTQGATPTDSHFLSAANAAGSATIGEYSSSSGTGWTANEAKSPTAAGTGNPNVTISGVNPMKLLSSGVVTETLWESTDDTDSSTTTAWTKIGTFSINANNGVDTWTFNGVDAGSAVPEPGAFGIFSGAGLLLLALRRQFSKKA